MELPESELNKHGQQSSLPDILVCDVGGVVLADGMETVLGQLSDDSGLSVKTVDKRYRRSGLRNALWTGDISTPTFWSRLGWELGRDLGDPLALDARMIDACQPLPSIDVLNDFVDRLWLATNHRAEWVFPALARSGLDISPDRIVCSSLVGSCKPMAAFYLEVVQVIDVATDETVVFFDDQESNLGPARDIGWDAHLVGSHPSEQIARLLR